MLVCCVTGPALRATPPVVSLGWPLCVVRARPNVSRKQMNGGGKNATRSQQTNFFSYVSLVLLCAGAIELKLDALARSGLIYFPSGSKM